jgi:formylglycine-generating enzyme required for sulfatase activity
MSPEQLMSNRIVLDRRTDIWSLGVTLYKYLTLADAFSAPTRQKLYHAILTKDPIDPRRLNPVIPADLKIVLETAMEKDRDRRYQTAHDLAEELRRVREHEPITARPAGPVIKLRRWAQRNPAVATAAALIFVFLVGGLALTTWFASNLDFAVTEYERLADGKLLDDLTARAANDLWPAVPDRVGDMDAWLKKADGLARTVKEHRAALEAMRETEGRREPAADASTEARWLFPDDRLQWRHDELTNLVERIDQFLGSGVIEDVRSRRQFARDVKKRSLDDHEALWNQAIAAVARDRRFQSFKLTKQLGLVPLGPDPVTGFWEFASLFSGEAPARDTTTKQLQMTEESGIVFVLLPGGWFDMGAQRFDEAQDSYHPKAADNEMPVHGVLLAPFMISKFEVTQGQWSRMARVNPSSFRAGTIRLGMEIDLRHPVENVSWSDCVDLLGKHCMLLPTEARWEYACRAGSSSPFYCGSEAEDLKGHANLADEGSRQYFTPEFPAEIGFSDGFSIHAPVGSLKPNSFGLHDMHGNVFEWCLERLSDYTSPTRDGDGLREGPKASLGIIRGGSFKFSALSARASSRFTADQVVRYDNLGVRPVWTLRKR